MWLDPVSKGCDNIRGHETCKALADGLSQLWQICWETHRHLGGFTGWSYVIVELILTRIAFRQFFSEQLMMSSNILDIFQVKYSVWICYSEGIRVNFSLSSGLKNPWVRCQEKYARRLRILRPRVSDVGGIDPPSNDNANISQKDERYLHYHWNMTRPRYFNLSMSCHVFLFVINTVVFCKSMVDRGFHVSVLKVYWLVSFENR